MSRTLAVNPFMVRKHKKHCSLSRVHLRDTALHQAQKTQKITRLYPKNMILWMEKQTDVCWINIHFLTVLYFFCLNIFSNIVFTVAYQHRHETLIETLVKEAKFIKKSQQNNKRSDIHYTAPYLVIHLFQRVLQLHQEDRQNLHCFSICSVANMHQNQRQGFYPISVCVYNNLTQCFCFIFWYIYIYIIPHCA